VPDVRLRPFIAYWASVPLERIGTEPGGTGEVSATNPLAQELVSRSLPGTTGAVPAHSWRLTGQCEAQQ
jgi:hypothetical protein